MVLRNDFEGTTQVNMQVIKQTVHDRLLKIRDSRDSKLTFLAGLTALDILSHISSHTTPMKMMMQVSHCVLHSSMTDSLMHYTNDVPAVLYRWDD
jgi:hypothetical protein